jgi:acetylornithine/succinyldiaminopimelate/putrescine aminotransferase
LRTALSGLAGVVEVRGAGLLLAVELSGVDAKTVYLKALERGLVTNAVTATALRLAPPLTVSSAEIREAVQILDGVLVELAP